MNKSSLPNVRLVRCPRCREVLPEPVDVPFYKCGGCDTILQAKHYKKENERRNLASKDSRCVQNNKVEYSAQGGEASTSNPTLSMDPNEGSSQSNTENGNLEQPGVSNSSREASSSSEPMQQPRSSSAQHFLERNERTEPNFKVTNTLGQASLLNELNSSPSHEVPSNLVPDTGEVEGDHRSAEQRGDSIASSSNESMEQLAQLFLENREVRQDEIVVEEHLEAADSRSEAASSETNTAKTDAEADELNQNDSINCRLEQPGVTKFPSEDLLSNEPSHHEPDNSSQVAVEEGQVKGGSTKVNEQLEVSNFSSEPYLSNEPTAGGDELSSQLVSQSKEVLITEQHSVANSGKRQPVSQVKYESGVSSTNEQVLTLQRNDSPSQFLTANEEGEVENVPSSVRSGKTIETNPTEKFKEEKATETSEVVNAHFEAGTSYRDLPKSPTRSSFAYDGSVSSYDGNDDQSTHQLSSGSMQGVNQIENPSTEIRRRYVSGRSRISSGSTFQHNMNNLQEVSSGKDLLPEDQIPLVMLTEIKMPEVLSDASYRRNRMLRPMTQEFQSRAPLYRRIPETRYGSSGHLIHREYYNHPINYPPYRYRDVESRFTRRNLHQSDVDGRMISEAVWMGEEFHMYPYHESSGEINPYPRHQMYYHGTRQTEYQPVVHSRARVPYSGETVSGYRVLDSYSHLYPSDKRLSSHLPPPGVSYSRGWYGPRDPFDSYTASPQVFSDSDYYATSHDAFSEDQRHTNQRMRRNSQPVQHFQPIGGAAPFITCYNCSELLQLPSDFLVFKGIKIHRVKCSACSTILKFTLEKGCHLVPYAPTPMADKLVKSASTSQANHDYEALHRRSASAQVSLRSSYQASERPKSRHSQNKGKSVMAEMHRHNNAEGGSSPDIPRNTKVTWKLPNRSSSPLHRLMGYSSPSAVYGYGSDDLDAQEYSKGRN